MVKVTETGALRALAIGLSVLGLEVAVVLKVRITMVAFPAVELLVSGEML